MYNIYIYIFCNHNISVWFATWVLNSLRLRLRLRLRLVRRRRHVIGLVPATATAVAVTGRHRRLNPSVTAQLF